MLEHGGIGDMTASSLKERSGVMAMFDIMIGDYINIFHQNSLNLKCKLKMCTFHCL